MAAQSAARTSHGQGHLRQKCRRAWAVVRNHVPKTFSDAGHDSGGSTDASTQRLSKRPGIFPL